MSVLHNIMIADRVVSLGLLAAGMSHHIRNSLVAVKTFLDLAPAKLKEEKLDLEGLRNPDFWRDYYHNVQGQVEKINGLLRDLWTASEKPAFIFTDQVRLHEVIAGAVARLQQSLTAKNISVENKVPDSLPPLTVDRPKFHRLFELLLQDEIVSLPAGSRITFTAQPSAGAVTNQPQVEIQVSDNGPGLPQESLRLIFDPFVVRSDSPMEYGINLMACYFIVHHHGGKIEARSEPGQGTNFTLRLPVDPNQAPSPEENRELVQKILFNETLLEKLLSSE
jgi:signal transduction histidine kinase